MSSQKLGQILEKPCVCSRGHLFSPIIMKPGQNVCVDESGMKMGHVRTKTRSQGQILGKLCVCSRDQIFSLIRPTRVAQW